MEFVTYMIRPLSRHVWYVVSCGKYIDALAHEMAELKSKRDDIKRLVESAERKSMEATNQVNWWLKSVEELEATASRIENAYGERQRLQFHSPSIKATYYMSKEADEARADAASLREKGNFDKVADELVQMRVEEMPSVPVFGMEERLQELHACLQDDSIVGTYGMAGVGKTELLSRFNNEFLVDSRGINVVIYIEVGQKWSDEELQRIISDRIGIKDSRLIQDPDVSKVAERGRVLYRALSKMNFVLLLDDVWEPLNFRMLGIPVLERDSKSKIVLATRIEDVCDRMDAHRKLKMECLPWGPAWELFCEKIGKHHMRSPEIEQHARKIAMMCDGHPLALITVGRAMASRRSAKEWKHANTVLKSAPWKFVGMETQLLVALRSSYDYLPDGMIRLCLLYCSLFPEGFSVPKDSIMGYCISEGFSADDIYTEMDDEFSFFKDWAEIASLQERSEDADHIRIHPMVRAMALWIASDLGRKERKWLVRAGVRLREAPSADKWCEAERISFMQNSITELYETPNCPSLKTLLLQGNPLSKICDGFFQSMPCLRVLDLSHTCLSELPSDISSLVELQYLNLHDTAIRSLPMELASLVNLRFLILSNVPLQMIPDGVIRSFTKLQVLYMDQSYGDWKVGDSGGSGVDFQELESLRRIEALDITIQSREPLEQLSQSFRLAGSTRNLLVKTCSSLTKLELPSGNHWKYMTSLKSVCIASCSSLAEVIIGDGEEPDANITQASAKLQGRAAIFDEHILPNLHDIILQDLHRVNIIYRGGCVPNLSSLSIQYCRGIEELITLRLCDKDQKLLSSYGEQAAGTPKFITPFPNLKELHLHGLLKCRTLSRNTCVLQFPSLERLRIVECPRLTKLKLYAPELNAIECTREWWDDLEWDDEEAKASFYKLFSEYSCKTINVVSSATEMRKKY